MRECLQPGASLAGVGMAHQANANMVRKWVVKYQRGGYRGVRGAGVTLLPVVVRKSLRGQSPGEGSLAPTVTLEIEMPTGRGALPRSARSGAAECRSSSR